MLKARQGPSPPIRTMLGTQVPGCSRFIVDAATPSCLNSNCQYHKALSCQVQFENIILQLSSSIHLLPEYTHLLTDAYGLALDVDNALHGAHQGSPTPSGALNAASDQRRRVCDLTTDAFHARAHAGVRDSVHHVIVAARDAAIPDNRLWYPTYMPTSRHCQATATLDDLGPELHARIVEHLAPWEVLSLRLARGPVDPATDATATRLRKVADEAPFCTTKKGNDVAPQLLKQLIYALREVVMSMPGDAVGVADSILRKVPGVESPLTRVLREDPIVGFDAECHLPRRELVSTFRLSRFALRGTPPSTLYLIACALMTTVVHFDGSPVCEVGISCQGAGLVHRLLRLGVTQRAWMPFLGAGDYSSSVPDYHTRFAREEETFEAYPQYCFRPMNRFVLTGLLKALAQGREGPSAAFYQPFDFPFSG
ncbi:hypothetical protein WJX74_002622 [Apatococcus lobatus]|uniref:Uncharacterized protein n=1 Tax=Apatococcus lobatus TaxID=904363 RepID=A0AAW1SF31_9CHLO